MRLDPNNPLFFPYPAPGHFSMNSVYNVFFFSKKKATFLGRELKRLKITFMMKTGSIASPQGGLATGNGGVIDEADQLAGTFLLEATCPTRSRTFLMNFGYNGGFYRKK